MWEHKLNPDAPYVRKAGAPKGSTEAALYRLVGDSDARSQTLLGTADAYRHDKIPALSRTYRTGRLRRRGSTDKRGALVAGLPFF